MFESFQPNGDNPQFRYEAAERWESGLIAGRLNWSASAFSSGTATMVGTPAHPQLNTALLVGSGVALRQGVASWDLSNGCKHRLDWRIAVSHIPTGIEPFDVRIGVSDGTGTLPVNGAVVTASSVSANWVLRVFSAGVPAAPVDTGVPIIADPLAATPVHIELLLTPAMIWLFINGISRGAVVSGLPLPATYWGMHASIRKDLVTVGAATPFVQILPSFYEERLEGAILYP